jgi:hypothetical protein
LERPEIKGNILNCTASRPYSDPHVPLISGKLGIIGHFQFLSGSQWGRTEKFEIELVNPDFVKVVDVKEK